jgi:hypothetical protein
MIRFMERLHHAIRFAIACIVFGAGYPAVAANVRQAFELGNWEIRELGPAPRFGRAAMCVRNIDQFLQREHPGASCTQSVIEEGAMSLTVHYTCPGKGWGRSMLRIETPYLARLETQGIARNLPFSYSAELRQTGDCGGR